MRVNASESPNESEPPLPSSPTTQSCIKWLHLGLAFAVPIVIYPLHRLFTGQDFPAGHLYSFVAPEFIAIAFVIGFIFAKSSPFPFRGWPGYAGGHFVACMIYGIASWNWFVVAFFAAVFMSAAPSVAELAGIMVGKAVPSMRH